MNRIGASFSHSWKSLAVAAAIAFLASAACSVGPAGNPVPTFGKGVITAKGSVFVNGVEYDTSSSAITVNDGVGSDADLKVGMVVEVKGSADSATGKGSATQILYSADLDGPVSSINVAGSSFTVFATTVAVDAATIWDGVAGLSALLVGDRVEVSGSFDTSSKTLKADRVFKKAVPVGTEGYEVKGRVSALGPGSFTLTPPDGASTLTVNFTGTLSPSIVDGSSVELRFASIAGSVITTTADKIKVESHLGGDDKSNGELSGRVSGFAVSGGTATFVVDGVSVSASATMAAGLSNGVKVEVRGSMSGGVLVASSIKTEKEANAELRGAVSAVSTTLGTLVVNGVTVTVDATTRFRDKNTSGGAVPVDHFGLASVSLGDYVEASGFYDPAATPSLLAEKVERLAPSSVALVVGPVSAASANSLTILGLPVDISGLAAKATLVAGITVGTTIVEAQGSFAAGTLTATSASIDN